MTSKLIYSKAKVLTIREGKVNPLFSRPAHK